MNLVVKVAATGKKSNGRFNQISFPIRRKSLLLKLDSFRVAATLELSFGFDSEEGAKVEKWVG